MDLYAVSSAAEIAYGVGVIVLIVILPMTITILKRQWLLFAAGWLVLGLVWWFAAFRLADPDSWWARRFYDEAKLDRARERYG